MRVKVIKVKKIIKNGDTQKFVKRNFQSHKTLYKHNDCHSGGNETEWNKIPPSSALLTLIT